MTETEIDAVVARLVPEFEITKLAAIRARDEYFALTAGACVNRAPALAALHRWQHLDAACRAILQHIEDLAERNAA
jgi:hypothetical protein